MTALRKINQDDITRLPVNQPKSVHMALTELTAGLVEACPPDAIVSFRFNGRLHVDIDIRGGEQAALVETLLPNLRIAECRAEFREVRRARSPYPFLLRITAETDA